MSKKLNVEKVTEDDQLTVEEQNQLLEDLMLLEAVLIGHQEYLKSIGKLKEGMEFVKKFMDNLTNDKMRDIIKDGKKH